MTSLLALSAHAAEVSVIDGTSVVGTIEEVAPSEIVVRSAGAAAPLRYSHSKATKYVDEAGGAVAMELVQSGLPVRIHYVVEGDRMIAERVVVRRDTLADVRRAHSIREPRRGTSSDEESSPQESTTSHGVVVGLGKNEITMVAESGNDATRYAFTETTQYVDDMGDPISIRTVKPGVSVTIHFAREASDFIARRVIVRRSEAVAALPAIAEELRSSATAGRFSE